MLGSMTSRAAHDAAPSGDEDAQRRPEAPGGRETASGDSEPAREPAGDRPSETADRPSETTERDGDQASQDTRRPRSVYGVGREPDVQSSLANQRTALAWVRTGLALIAGGVALTTVAGGAQLSLLLDAVAVVACLGGGALGLAAIASWGATERALRLGEPLPRPHALPWLVGGVVVVAIVLGVHAVLELTQR